MTELDEILSGKGAVAPEPQEKQPGNEAVEEVKAEQVETDEAVEDAGADADADDGTKGGDQKTVPHAAYHAEKQKVKRYTEQVADFERKLTEQNAAWERRFNQLIGSIQQPQQQQPEAQEVPEIWDDPTRFVGAQIEPLKQQMQQQRLEMSKIWAVEKYGADLINEADAALSKLVESDPRGIQLRDQIASSSHPYGALVDWHKRQKAAAEIGDDPAAYREKLKAEILAEMEAEKATDQQQQQGPAPVNGQVMPSNLAGKRNVGDRSGPVWSGPQPLNDIFANR